MTVNEIAFTLEELQIKSWALNSLTLAVHDAIIEGPNDASNFDGALHVLTCMTYELGQEMDTLCKALFEVIQSGKEVA